MIGCFQCSIRRQFSDGWKEQQSTVGLRWSRCHGSEEASCGGSNRSECYAGCYPGWQHQWRGGQIGRGVLLDGCLEDEGGVAGIICRNIAGPKESTFTGISDLLPSLLSDLAPPESPRPQCCRGAMPFGHHHQQNAPNAAQGIYTAASALGSIGAPGANLRAQGSSSAGQSSPSFVCELKQIKTAC